MDPRPDAQTVEFACRLRVLGFDWDRVLEILELAWLTRSDTRVWTVDDIRGAFAPDQVRRESAAPVHPDPLPLDEPVADVDDDVVELSRAERLDLALTLMDDGGFGLCEVARRVGLPRQVIARWRSRSALLSEALQAADADRGAW